VEERRQAEARQWERYDRVNRTIEIGWRVVLVAFGLAWVLLIVGGILRKS
jgi:hypothetical protein